MAEQAVGFDWDKGNLEKSWLKHGVKQNESEEVFVDPDTIVSEDPKHSQIEKRWLLLGKAKQGRYLAVVFTKRKDKIRVISARPMNQKERKLMRKSKLLPVPRFSGEDEEREFWAKADTSKYFDFSKFKRAKFPNLKLSTQTISLRMPKGLLEEIKIAANRRDVPYQSLIKIYLDEAVNVGSRKGRIVA